MSSQQISSLVSFIWGIADDCLRDVYVCGKYRDVILPMTVVRRLDAVLEPTKKAVLPMVPRTSDGQMLFLLNNVAKMKRSTPLGSRIAEVHNGSSLYPGGVDAFLEKEVLPFAPDAWINPAATRIGYELSFTKYFYKPAELRPLSVIAADLRALETETAGLLDRILEAA